MTTRRILCTLLYAFLAFSQPLLAVETLTYEQAKANYIYNFLKYVLWPPEAVKQHYTIGLYGNDKPLSRELKRLIQSTPPIRGNKIRLQTIDTIEQSNAVHMLVIAASHNWQIKQIAEEIAGKPILIVTDNADDKSSVMINFTFTNNKNLSFEVNSRNINNQQLTLAPKILLLGGTELDALNLYVQMEAKLSRMNSTVTQQQKDIETKQKQIEAKQKQISLQKKQLKKQQENIKRQALTINRQGKTIKERETKLTNLLSRLDTISNALIEGEEKLKSKATVVDDYAKKIEINISKLVNQKDEIKKMEQLIQEKNKVLSDQITTIRTQKYALSSTTIALLLGLVLVVVIYRANRQKQQTNEALKRLAQTKSQFLSTMSHEIRTPMNGVLGILELLRDTKLDDQQQRYLKTIQTSGRVLLAVINDILDFSKIEAGKMLLEDIDIDLEELIYSSASIFSMRISPTLDLLIDMPPDTPKRIRGDPTRLRQILLNLLSNAFKFTRIGEINVYVEYQTRCSPPLLTITVQDTGPGIGEEQQNIIFDSFSQVDMSTTRHFGGTGLGLAISSKLARMMRGELSVSSTEGKGASFTLSLPMPTTMTRSVETPHNILLDTKKVWVIDSKPLRACALCRHLQAWGMYTSCFQTLGKTASQQPVFNPDIIIFTQTLESLQPDDITRISGQTAKTVLLYYENAKTPQPAPEATQWSAMLTMPASPSLIKQTLTALWQPSPTDITICKLDEKIEDDYSDLNVLIAEDNDVNQMVICGMLKKFGIKPTCVTNGQDAILSYTEKNQKDGNTGYDIILMDCEMPVLDGYDATQKIRQIEASRGYTHIPIVALTAHAMDEFREKALACGMDDHLVKPLQLTALHSLLTRFSHAHQQSP